MTAMTPAHDAFEPVRGLDLLYVAMRTGAPIDPQAAFDIATEDFGDLSHADAKEVALAARRLAEASLAEDQPSLAVAAAELLQAFGYQPGFAAAPDRLARIEVALDAVQEDLRATGLTGDLTLVPDSYRINVLVRTWAGDTGWTAGVFSSEAADDLSALVAVAEQASQAVMESLDYQCTGRVWPACPEHGLCASPQARNGIGVWWCDGNDGHVVAAIGHWPMAAR
jgi:hypothetical protein